MAFAVTGLSVLSPGKAGFNVLVYNTADNASVVETASYFDTIATTLTANDLIIAQMGDALKLYQVDTITAGVVAITERQEWAAPATAIVTLTDSTTGTAGDTVDDTTASVKDDIASLAAKINAILVVMRARGHIAG